MLLLLSRELCSTRNQPEALISGKPLQGSSSVLQLVLSARLQAWVGHGYGLKSSATSKRPVKWSSDTWTTEDTTK